MVTGDQATARITGKLTPELPGEEPDTDTSTYGHLKKEDGKWRIRSAEAGKH